MQYFTIGISVFALVISGVTLWLTHLRRGALKMTRPTIVYFGIDGIESDRSKVYLRAFLYSTGKRGILLENMFLRLRRGETQQNFNVWHHDDKELERGCGLFVGQEGVAMNHHFVMPSDIKAFDFAAGEYELEIFGKICGKGAALLLSTIRLSVDALEAEQLRKPSQNLFFDWAPDVERYHKDIRSSIQARAVDPMKFLEGYKTV